MTNKQTYTIAPCLHPWCRMALLLLMMVAGVGEMRGQTTEPITTPTYYDVTQSTKGGKWTSANTGRYTVDDTTNDYTYIAPVGTGDNGTRVYTSSTNVVTAGVSYVLSFDIWLKGGTNQLSWLQVNDAQNLPVDLNSSTTRLSSSILLLSQTAAGGTTWSINGSSTQTVELNTSYWYHFELTRTYDKTYLKVTYENSGTQTAFAEAEITTNSTVGGLGNMEFATKRYSAEMSIDNLYVMKWGWDVIGHTVNLTNANNDNKITSGMPTLYNPDNATVTYSYDGTVLGNYDQSYPPRMKTTGAGSVTATIDGRTSQYTLNVTAPTVSGTYDQATKTYTFATVGKLASNTVSDVPGITMTADGGQAVVVNDGTRTVLKVIDGNGYSHPFDLSTAYPTMGTYYRFVPSENGTLTVSGNFSSSTLHTTASKTNLLVADGGNYKASLEIGNTYYLYNGGEKNTTPLLHSFTYVPNATSLVFRNPQPVITVDIDEGSYTNPATSVVGLPVSYSILSGPATVDADGRVTFNSGLTEPSYSVTVKASTEASGGYAAAAVSYTLNLVRRTWVFDDNSKWTTTSSSLGSNWDANQSYTSYGLNGTTFCREKNEYSYTELMKDGSNVLPETRGLLVSKAANSDRLYIAPKDYSPNFLAMRASFIAIDDVQAGQTVTVDWYGGNSSAVLDLSDAAGENVRGTKRGSTSLTASQTGRVTIVSNAIVSYIRSIKVSSPTRAVGTLGYAKTVLSGSATETLATFTITDEAGVTDLTSAYGAPQSFESSNPSIVSVNASTGELTAHSTEGVAVITATALAKNSVTHQEAVTLVATVEVVSSDAIRIRTIEIEDLMYAVGATGVNATDGLNRRIPGFDLTFTGGDGVKCNDAGSLLLRNGSGTMTITPRARGGETITITKAILTVKAAEAATFTVNGSSQTAVVGGMVFDGLTGSSLSFASTAGSMEITGIRLYYQCSESENADYCLDETKVAPELSFATSHFMRVPGDGRAFTQTPILTAGDYFKSFDISYSYASSATSIATVYSDGTNGQLLTSGEATITATFNETTYFAAATATYSVSNTLLPGESYDGITIEKNSTGVNKKFVHIMAKANAAATDLTLAGTNATLNTTKLTYGTATERRNTYAETTTADTPGSVTLSNNSTTGQTITIYWIHVVKPNLQKWIYYKGQDENFKEQVQFAGFETGAVEGFHVMDVGDADNPIDLTDAYSWDEDGAFSTLDAGVLTSFNTETGNATAATGTTTLSRQLKKTGQADGYDETLTAQATVVVLPFSAGSPVVWSFINNVDNADNTLGYGWSYDDRGFQYGYFGGYTPVLDKDNNAYSPNDSKQMHGIMLKDEFRWYASEPARGLRANLSAPNSSIKFPVKKGMEIEIVVATSSADITNTITNVTDLNGNPTSALLIEEAGWTSNTRAYFLAAEDGCVELFSVDKVGMYLKSIKLKVPEIHFTDDVTTVLATAGTVTNAPINIPSGRSLTYSITSASKFDTDGNEEELDSEHYSDVASIGAGTGVVTLAGQEGKITVHVVNNDATGVEANEGDYTMYIVNFRFYPTTGNLNTDDHDGEAYFEERPLGINKVGTSITYSFEVPSGSAARAMLAQSTNADPALTTYKLTAYSKGTIIVKATTGRITTECTLEVSGHVFGRVAPVLSEQDITGNAYVYEIPLPDDYNNEHWKIEFDYVGEFYTVPNTNITSGTINDLSDSKKTVDVSNLWGDTDTGQRNHGAIRFVTTFDGYDGIPGTSDDKTTQTVLTIAYPASSGHKWQLFSLANGLQIGEIGNYVGDHLYKQEHVAKTIESKAKEGDDPRWTTSSTWTKIYRNSDKEPRWSYDKSVKNDNAFIVEETAGLQIETAPNSFYVDNNSTAAYYHFGIHGRSTVTIPRLKDGDFVRLNMSRVIPNNGAILSATNVTDLRGKEVTDNFTITRSQIDHADKPGYYTFIAKNLENSNEEFDVSFTLRDEGYLDILSVEIYDKNVADLYLGTQDVTTGYQHTMKPVKLSSYPDYPDAPTILLKEDDEQNVYSLCYCNPMWSTSVGPAEYVLKGLNDGEDGLDMTERKYYVDDATQADIDAARQNLDIKLENVGWYSSGGGYYNDGLITVNRGYGKLTVRMNNYTAEGKYLIGYSPDYTLTVGHRPHQEYPYTWNFTNISGGEVKGERNNVYNSVDGDTHTWTSRGSNVFELDTDTEGGSLYVPGATLVSTQRDLGMDGTATELAAADNGCDEFNGLGFEGQVMFMTESQSSSAKERTQNKVVRKSTTSLLSYSMDNTNYASTTSLTAGNGTIYFGADKREVSSFSYCGYGYKCDGDVGETSTKYALLTPSRAFRAGDVMEFKVYTTSTPHGSDYGLCLYSSRSSTTPLATLYIPDGSEKNKEVTLRYVVSGTDGIKGLESIYVFRAPGKSTYIDEVNITNSTLTAKTLYAVAPTTITIPDLNADGKQDWIYIKASKAPTAITNATLVTDAATGGNDVAATDANGISTYKYKVTAAGNSEVTFTGDTEIDQIGVTHIMKEITKVGEDAWATESREHAIDHSLTGYFTANDVNAYTVTAKEYVADKSKATVQLNAISEDGFVPEGTGLVLKLAGVTSDEGAANLAKVNSWNSTDGTGKVPLFYPAMSTGQTSTALDFPASNMMRPRLVGDAFYYEGETVSSVDYYRFILAKRYMTWKKNGSTLTVPTAFESREAAVFYRMHLYTNDEAKGVNSSADAYEHLRMNTLGRNKAYLLLPADKLNPALWSSSGGSAPRRYVGILGISDMYGDDESDEGQQPATLPTDGKTYNLRGQQVNDDGSLPPGIYIRDGRKIIVR